MVLGGSTPEYQALKKEGKGKKGECVCNQEGLLAMVYSQKWGELTSPRLRALKRKRSVENYHSVKLDRSFKGGFLGWKKTISKRQWEDGAN